jgi:ribosomal RNA-processing protein 12
VCNIEIDPTLPSLQQSICKICPLKKIKFFFQTLKKHFFRFFFKVVIGETLQKWRAEDEVGDVIKDYMTVVLAGLAGGPTMIHCSLLAITRIYYQFHDIFPDDLTEMLIENICLLLTSQCREVVGSSVSFLHVFITSAPVMGSARFCEKIVTALCKMTEDCKRHFRLKTR